MSHSYTLVSLILVQSSLMLEMPHLVGGLNPSEKYEFVNWDDYSQYMGK